ncbi:MAG: 1-(5-phosphoribosyl)-5-[(5-phosphoribosylamino)methylideneamino]imidazole-4-carboxamide isomerase [Candidatus Omnitrophica bacterium]|nr:1-(5-phosphoribosyl)-5-[(5-phosphoribosylamino)methylideneamino]imidazole-4-carboxamide isomerase [Candidatus Omnitrophota bacterium]
MILFPAIDIKDGKVVRLQQGKFDDVTVYSEVPLEMAKKWKEQGAQWLHVVDLDGAKTGEIKNLDVILEIAKTIGIPVQMGGGVRSHDAIRQLLEGGVRRVVLGTKVVDDMEFLKAALDQWEDRIAVSLDCSNGKVSTRGWTQTSDIRAVDIVKDLEEMGLKYLIYTDISRDGMLSGPNIQELMALLKATTIPVIASGGISNLADVENLKSMREFGIIGAITGKAIYEGTLDFKKAIEICLLNE